MQLCILPFLAFCRAEWHPIIICTCAPLPNHRRGDTNAICFFFAGATRLFILVFICVRKCICLVIYAVYAEEGLSGYKCNALINSELLVNGKCIWCVQVSSSTCFGWLISLIWRCFLLMCEQTCSFLYLLSKVMDMIGTWPFMFLH